MDFNKEKIDKINTFVLEKSPAKEAYILLGAKNPKELFVLYAKEDQKLFKSGAWDYKNPVLKINKVKNILENIKPQELSVNEKDYVKETIWFWYHHAISSAIWKYKDREEAKKFSALALEKQSADSPNQITKILDFLVNDKVEEARKFVTSIKKEPEKSSAIELIEEYEQGKFF